MTSIKLSKAAVTRASQFNIRHASPLIRAITLAKNANVIKFGLANTLIAIAKYWNKEGKTFPSHQKLAELTGLHRRSIVTHIDKLTSLNIINTEQRYIVRKDGSKRPSTLNYTFNPVAIGLLLEQAKFVFRDIKRKMGIFERNMKRAEEKKAAQASKQAILQQVDPLKKITSTLPEKDHTIKSSKDSQEKENFNTVSKKHASQGKSQIQKIEDKAMQDETEHYAKLKLNSAYESAKYKNQVARGEVFSKAELAIRKVRADKIRAYNEKTRAAREANTALIRELDSKAMMHAIYGDSLTASEAATLRNLVDSNAGGISLPATKGLKRFEAQNLA